MNDGRYFFNLFKAHEAKQIAEAYINTVGHAPDSSLSFDELVKFVDGLIHLKQTIGLTPREGLLFDQLVACGAVRKSCVK